MILFACARHAMLPEIQRHGLRFSEPGHKLHRTLEGARRECGSRILVVELGPKELSSCTVKERTVFAPHVALDLFLNLNPFLSAVPVAAGGGLVVRPHREEYEVILIHRRGTWDLPKGKQDDEETIEDCAVREVREELGIDDVELLGPAGQTVHGYARGRRYHVKTTHWYWMTSGSTVFAPQADEHIDSAEWVPWKDAARRVGYRTLRELLRTVNPARSGV